MKTLSFFLVIFPLGLSLFPVDANAASENGLITQVDNPPTTGRFLSDNPATGEIGYNDPNAGNLNLVPNVTRVSADIVAIGRTLEALNLRVLEDVLNVVIDIRPGSDPNRINPRSKATIEVAILSALDFDATTEVDEDSLTFGRTGDEDSLHRRGRNQVRSCGTKDVNDDDLDDLVCRFKIQDTGIACGDTSASLKGQTFDGQMIERSDSIRTVGCK